MRKADTGGWSLVVTMRPAPENNLKVLQYDWGVHCSRRFSPAELCRVSTRVVDALKPTSSWVGALQHHQLSRIYRLLTVDIWTRERTKGDSAEFSKPPEDVDAAYCRFFDGSMMRSPHIDRLLCVTMAAFEPLSFAHLHDLGLLQTCESLPGWGLLFDERDHCLHMLHLSLREFLTDPTRSGKHAVRSFCCGVLGLRCIVEH